MLPTTSDFGAAPPIVAPLTLTWLLGLSLAPWLLATVLVRAAGLRRREAQLVAYNVTALAPNVFQAVVGGGAWFFDNLQVVGATRYSRLYLPVAKAERLISVTIAYETWNTAAALFIPEYRTAAFVAHHASTLYLALLCTHPYVHYYSLFFIGPPGISSVLLCLVDVLRHCDQVASRLPTTTLVLRATFAVTFLVIRAGIWPVVSVWFWRDSLATLAAGEAHSDWAVAVYLAANIGLTGLQAMWSVKIVQGLRKAIFCDATKPEKD